MKVILAHCPKHDKWFVLSVNNRGLVDNFENISDEMAKAYQTNAEGTSFSSAPNLLPCSRCGSRKCGRCGHTEKLGLCRREYSFQCLYCNHLRISLREATSHYTVYAGQNIIPGAVQDKYGNPQGSQYDLAKDDGFRGYRIVILAINKCYTKSIMSGPIDVLERKGFSVKHILLGDRPYFDHANRVDDQALSGILDSKTQLWILTDSVSRLGEDSLRVVENFYQSGGGLYLWGDNDPLHVDADIIGKRLFGITMQGDYYGCQTLGIKQENTKGGIIPGHPISTGIVRFFEGDSVAAVQTNQQVIPLVYSSDGNVVTAYVDSNGRRCLIDGAYTRLYCSSFDNRWDSAGTGRFVANCAAWLANADRQTEVPFT